jgi:REP element-mobilizing transposase RayT
LTDHDREVFLSILGNICNKFNWHFHAYCLMSNHYHLLVETPLANISKGMQYLNGIYTQSFNRMHHRVGHVFQGRFKAILVEKESYLLELSRYIVLNPVRAHMVSCVDEWPWSSYLATAGLALAPTWLNTDWILSIFGDCKLLAHNRYQKFVNEADLECSPWEDLKQQIYLGSNQFVTKMQSNINPLQDFTDIPSLQYTPVPLSLMDYKQQASSRDEAIRLAYASGSFSMNEVGNYFDLHYSTVSRIINLK